MTDAAEPTIVADRLYGINLRPQELAIYGERVHFALRYAVTNEHPEEPSTSHTRLLVLEITTDLPADDELALPERRLELAKCGWEIELATEQPVRGDELAESPREIEHALERVADTVNELARRGGLEAPLGPDLVGELVVRYRNPVAP